MHQPFVKDANYYEVSEIIIKKLISEKPSFFSQKIEIGKIKIQLTFEKSDIFAPDFNVKTSNGQVIYPDMKNVLTYRGVVNGDLTSWATLSVIEGKLQYLIAMDNGNYEINESTNGHYVGYFSRDQKTLSQYQSKCEDDHTADHQNNHAPSGGSRIGSCLEIYFECDFKTYQDHGSNVTNVTNWVIALMNNIATVYAINDVPIISSQIFVWTTQDPYASLTNIGAIRDLFVTTRQNNYIGRIAQLLSTRPLSGGIAYGVGGFCNTYPSYPGPFCVSSQLSTAITPFPNYSFNTYVIAHEIGHVMGLRHTHACVWNNTNTQIDDCGNVYANNNGNTPEGDYCFNLASPILPVGGGTIMSECQLLAGTGVNLNNGFGPIPGQMLFNNFVYASCTTGATCGILPPVNDNCADAISLQVNYSCVNGTFNNIRATPSTGVPAFTCGSPGSVIKDVWFKLVIPPSGGVTIETSQVSGGLTDVLIQAYAGVCNSLVAIGCDDNNGAGNHSLLILTGRIPGETIFIRLVDTNSDNEGSFSICAYNAALPCHQDFTFLIDFYNNTSGPSWTVKTGWQAGAAGTNCSVCTWFGITCNNQGRVIGISLPSNNLTSGNLPLSMTNITYLNTLNLYNNNLSGSIPSFFNNYSYLLTLDLGGNDFTGSIQSNLGSINSLKNLYLDGNLLTGALPVSLTNNALSLIYLNNNNLSGCYPDVYSEYCFKAYSFSNNPLLANGISFDNFCSHGIGIDKDKDSFCSGGLDCDDTDNTIYPGATETCNLKDDNCNGLIDDVASPVTNTWIAASGDWNIATNWSLGTVPSRCQNVIISGVTGIIVTIASGQIGLARSITIQSGKSLVISGSASLTINYGLNVTNAGTITNNGVLTINNILDNSLYGISNTGTIVNGTTGNITIQNSGTRSLSNNSGGIITNNGILTIDKNAFNNSSTGLHNAGIITNNKTLTIKNITGKEVIVAPGATFTNQMTGVLSLQ
ncbi:MAG: hypothetical protein IPO92_01420 [Saprospiraceae bacterium]|nr:hypothetical protein [Saprospiraceae bacterium]